MSPTTAPSNVKSPLVTLVPAVGAAPTSKTSKRVNTFTSNPDNAESTFTVNNDPELLASESVEIIIVNIGRKTSPVWTITDQRTP